MYRHLSTLLSTSAPFCILLVILRFLSRHIMRAGFWWDDWCSVMAMIFSYALNVVQFFSIRCGLGRHTAEVGVGGVECFLKSLYAVEPFYAVCMPTIKASMLLLYWRLFGSVRQIRVALFITTMMLIAWLIGALSSGIFQCTPIQKFWQPELPGRCINGLVYFRAIASTNLVTDVIVLILPLPIIRRLHCPTSEKLALTGIFLLGTFVSVVSIVRIISLVSPSQPDILWYSPRGTMWTAVETSAGVVCINLPIMRPLLRRFILGQTTRNAPNSSYGTLQTSVHRIQPNCMQSCMQSYELDEQEILVTTHFQVTSKGDEMSSL